MLASCPPEWPYQSALPPAVEWEHIFPHVLPAFRINKLFLSISLEENAVSLFQGALFPFPGRLSIFPWLRCLCFLSCIQGLCILMSPPVLWSPPLALPHSNPVLQTQTASPLQSRGCLCQTWYTLAICPGDWEKPPGGRGNLCCPSLTNVRGLQTCTEGVSFTSLVTWQLGLAWPQTLSASALNDPPNYTDLQPKLKGSLVSVDFYWDEMNHFNNLKMYHSVARLLLR